MSDTVIRPVDPEAEQEEERLYQSLRAEAWSEFYGQARVKEALQLALTAAKQRSEVLEHILFYGPPGLGKTTLSHIVAKEMGVNIRVTSGPALERAGDIASILTNMQDGDVLFIDEIHRLNRTVEETIYPAMEDYRIDVVLGKGPSARVALKLLKRVRDYAQVNGTRVIAVDSVEGALNLLEVDHLGLDRSDRRILETIIEKFQGGPVGLSTLAASTAEDVGTIEDVYEPFLLRAGLIARTNRGRVVTAKAYEHLGLPVKR